jgi:methyl-accepting chemotaxis protein
VSKLRTRFSIFLRQTEIGDRRRHDRLPCMLPVTLECAGKRVSGNTLDLGAGGALIATDQGAELDRGARCSADIAEIGRLAAVVVARSSLGLHLHFIDVDAAVRARLEAKIDAVRQDNVEFVDRAMRAAAQVSALLDRLVADGRISEADLFDNEYVPIADTNPQQYRTRYVELLEQELSGMLDRFRTEHSRMAFCVVVDRNGFLPVHNREYSHPQRRADPEWNMAHSRNRMIFDSRAGLCAARSTRPYLVQTNPRHMGGGKVIMMKEVAAPLRVRGKHWGGLRMAYEF